jgi:flagellar hook assembly protein FlgD
VYNPAQPIHLTQSTTVKARAYLQYWTPSDIMMSAYIINVANLDDTEVPVAPGIVSCYPNPFTQSTSVRIFVPKGSHLEDVSIYDIKGKIIKTLDFNSAKNGILDLEWNGSSDKGTSVPSGLYLIKCKIDNKVSTKKVSVLK